MNVCDQRHIHFRSERAQCFCCLFIRHGDPDDICARLMQGMDLRGSSVRIERAERAHRLDRNGRAPTDPDTADNDLFGISHLNLLFVVVYMNVWFRVRFAFQNGPVLSATIGMRIVRIGSMEKTDDKNISL